MAHYRQNVLVAWPLIPYHVSACLHTSSSTTSLWIQSISIFQLPKSFNGFFVPLMSMLFLFLVFHLATMRSSVLCLACLCRCVVVSIAAGFCTLACANLSSRHSRISTAFSEVWTLVQLSPVAAFAHFDFFSDFFFDDNLVVWILTMAGC